VNESYEKASMEQDNQAAEEQLVEEQLTEEQTPGDEPAQEGESLAEQVKDLQEKLLRSMADFDNFRRRTRQEKEELAAYANSKLIADLLPVLDNFTLALAASQTTADDSGIIKGIEMVHRQLIGVLEQVGVQTMDPVGQPFDPNQHEAVGTTEAEGFEQGAVVEVLRTGYKLKDKVLRPAMVKINS
jgi:molecular chaperone GrpE